MIESVSQIDKKPEVAAAFHYSLNRWESLCRYTEDGRVELDNNIAEPSIRGIGSGRRNYLFFGSADPGLWALVESELKKCRTLIVICSEVSVESDWVAREVQWMLDARGDASVLLAISGSSDPKAAPERIFP